MTEEDLIQKQCCDCGMIIQFENFLAMHPSLQESDAEELYKNPLIGIYCPNCWFQRPEKPFKKRRRFNRYNFFSGPRSNNYIE